METTTINDYTTLRLPLEDISCSMSKKEQIGNIRGQSTRVKRMHPSQSSKQKEIFVRPGLVKLESGFTHF